MDATQIKGLRKINRDNANLIMDDLLARMAEANATGKALEEKELWERLMMVKQQAELNDDVLRVALGLAEMAEKVARYATEPYQQERPLELAYAVQHEVTWGVANLNLDALVNSTVNLARAMARVEAAKAAVEEAKKI